MNLKELADSMPTQFESAADADAIKSWWLKAAPIIQKSNARFVEEYDKVFQSLKFPVQGPHSKLNMFDDSELPPNVRANKRKEQNDERRLKSTVSLQLIEIRSILQGLVDDKN